MNIQRTQFSSDDLPNLSDQLQSLGVQLGKQPFSCEEKPARVRSFSSPMVFVDQSTRLGFDSTTVHHHHYHQSANASPRDDQQKKRKVALGVTAVIGTVALSYLIGKSINYLYDAKAVKTYLSGYTCDNNVNSLTYWKIEQAVDGMVANRQ